MQTVPAVTTATPFLPFRLPAHPPMLSVNAGVPIADALAEVACLIESAKEIVWAAATEDTESKHPLFAARYLLDMAEGFIEAVEHGLQVAQAPANRIDTTEGA